MTLTREIVLEKVKSNDVVFFKSIRLYSHRCACVDRVLCEYANDIKRFVLRFVFFFDTTCKASETSPLHVEVKECGSLSTVSLVEPYVHQEIRYKSVQTQEDTRPRPILDWSVPKGVL